MKRIICLFVSLFVVFSINSCKRLGDDDGNLLNDMDANQGGLTGPRFLYQEYNSVDTLAEYHYTGMKLSEVIGKKAKTVIGYNGDLINKITYNSKLASGDSIEYTRFYNYDVNNVLTYITEVHTTFPKPVTPPPTTPVLPKVWKSLYNLTYNSSNQLTSIFGKTGQEIAGQAFAFSNYKKWDYTYDIRSDVSKMVYTIGTLNASGVPDPYTGKLTFDYANYDDMKNPYSLLPFAYAVNQTLGDPNYAYWLSPHNPKRIVRTVDGLPPVTTTVSTQYTYDPQGYALSGWGINYDYRPF